MQLAWRLGFAGAAARLTGQQDPRLPGEIAFARLLAAERTETTRVLSTALRAAGVRHCFVKGAALDACYRPGERDADDLDVLVARDDLSPCTASLAIHGYAPVRGADQAAPPAMRRGLEFVGPGDLSPVLDLQWGLTSVNRLLSDCDAGVLEPLWNRVLVENGVSVPPPAWHLALLVHHLVHHDLLHARAVLDLLLVGEHFAPSEVEEVLRVAAALRVRRVTEAWLTASARRLGGAGLPGTAGPRLTAAFDPARLFALSDRAPAVEHQRITWARLRRRFGLLDRRRDVGRLLRDALVPPDVYLRWRWPTASGRLERWFRHAWRTAGKLIFPG